MRCPTGPRLQQSHGGVGRHTSCFIRTRGRPQSIWRNLRPLHVPHHPLRALRAGLPRRDLLPLLDHHFGRRHRAWHYLSAHRYAYQCHGLKRRAVSRFIIKMKLLLRFHQGPLCERRHRALFSRQTARHRHGLNYCAVSLFAMKMKLPLRFGHGHLCEGRP